MGSSILRPALVLLLSGTLIAFGGTYRWSTLPILLASAALYFFSRSVHLPAARGWTAVDCALVAILIAIAVQLVPLPPGIGSALTPEAARVRSILRLDAALRSPDEWWPITLDSTATWHALANWAAAVLTFWGARRIFAEGGARALCRAMAWLGLVMCLVAVAQRATSPKLIYGFWQPEARGATPFGPYVDRNLFAGWLVLAIPLVAGYFGAHVRVRVLALARGSREFPRLLFASGAATTATMLMVMTLTLVLTLSRSGMVALTVAGGVAWWLTARRGMRDTPFLVGFFLLTAVIVLLALTYGNPYAVLERFKSGLDPSPRGRLVIWRETLPIVRDFWVTGTGAGAFGRAMLLYQQSDPRFFFNFAHNQYLQLAAEGGLLVSIPVAVSAICYMRAAWRRLNADLTEAYWLRVGACCALVGSAVQGIWDWPVQMPGNALLFATAAALLISKRDTSSQ